MDRRCRQEEDACWAAFRVFDIDCNGRITYEELHEAPHVVLLLLLLLLVVVVLTSMIGIIIMMFSLVIVYSIISGRARRRRRRALRAKTPGDTESGPSQLARSSPRETPDNQL